VASSAVGAVLGYQPSGLRLAGRALPVVMAASPGALLSPGVLIWSWVSSSAGRCGWVLHFVPTARGKGWSWSLPTFCPYGALAVVGLPGGGCLGQSFAVSCMGHERCRGWYFGFKVFSWLRRAVGVLVGQVGTGR